MSVPLSPPPNWLEVYQKIEQVRSESSSAPVDMYGAESLSGWDKVEKGEIDVKLARYWTLIALLLSSQTRDAATAAAMEELKKFGLTPENMSKASEEEIGQCIRTVGFYNRKATYIKKTSQILLDKYQGDVPNNMKDITALPGIGPKMGFLLMQIAWNDTVGIGVDVHVHRITNRLKWVQNTSDPEETRVHLQSWLPKEYWSKVNKVLVGFGQTICSPISPKCSKCPVNDLCPSAEL